MKCKWKLCNLKNENLQKKYIFCEYIQVEQLRDLACDSGQRKLR